METHAIERTSPTGPGQKFIGICMKCGKPGLTFADMDESCGNTSGLSPDETLVRIVEGQREP